MMKKIDDIHQYAETLRKSSRTIHAQKTGCILARIGNEGEEIFTFVSDGMLETTNCVRRDRNGNPGVVATRADASGNRITDSNGHTNTMIIPREVFDRKYRESAKVCGDERLFHPADGIQEFIQIGEDISFTAPWGTEQRLKAGSYLNVTDPEDIYGIEREAFQQTYAHLNSEESEN